MKNVTIEPSPYSPGGPIAFYMNGKFYVRLKPLEALNIYEALAENKEISNVACMLAFTEF